MHRKITDNVAVIAEAVWILVVFGLIYLTMTQSTTYFVITVSFAVTALMFIFMTIRSFRRANRTVRRITDEIATLPADLSEKSYEHIQDETRIFYDELTRVKRLLSKRGQMRQELLDIVHSIASNMEFGKLLRELMPKLNEATRSNCCAFYAVNHSTHKLEIRHSVGFSKNVYGEFDLTLGEGMIGQAATKQIITLYRDIPEDTVYFIRTFLGKIKPRNLMIVPVISGDQLAGVLVCASIYDYTAEDREMTELIKHYLGVAVNNGSNYEKNKRLTNELTFQNKLIQDQHEEMKKKLDEKTQLLNNLMNYIGDDCLYTLDTRGVILVWNQGAEKMHAINRHEAVGKHIDRVYEEYHWPSINKALQTALKNGSYTECFWRYEPEGKKQCYEMTMTCMQNEQNEPIGILNRIVQIEKSPE